MTTPPPTGDRQFQDEIIRLAELTVNTNMIEGLQFSNCRIIGPAVIYFQNCEVLHCGWDAPDLETLFWEVPSSRTQVIGAIMFRDCIFSDCQFEQIGVAGGTDVREALQQGTR